MGYIAWTQRFNELRAEMPCSHPGQIPHGDYEPPYVWFRVSAVDEAAANAVVHELTTLMPPDTEIESEDAGEHSLAGTNRHWCVALRAYAPPAWFAS